MSVIFISHSSRDNLVAKALRDWLRQGGWGEVFLDLDPDQGIAPGQRWRDELARAGEQCSAILLILSPNWVASSWCLREFEQALTLNKPIFPVIVSPTPLETLPASLVDQYQFVDLSIPAQKTEALERLAIGLRRAGVHPNDFTWPPPSDPGRAVYRGLSPLEEIDAPIYFGRNTATANALEAIRRLRVGGRERSFIILGASGSGKSSFLRAGLLARLRRDQENYIVLPVIRPGLAAMTGLAGVEAAFDHPGLADLSVEQIAQVLDGIRAPTVDRLVRIAEAARETWTGQPPTIILAFDQLEEVFSAENQEAEAFFRFTAKVLAADPNVLFLSTIRSDDYAHLQSDSRIGTDERLLFDLPPLQPAAYKEVIEGPARIGGLKVEPGLADRLLADLAMGDALPILGFALQRLYTECVALGCLTLDAYLNKLNGLKGVIDRGFEIAFTEAATDPLLPKDHEALLGVARQTFIPSLVQLDSPQGLAKRRPALLGDLPAASRALVPHLIQQRLIVANHSAQGDIVEVAHEAIFRQWTPLAEWIEAERENLLLLEGVKSAAADWMRNANDRRGAWLLHHGARLAAAQALSLRADFESAFDNNARTYLAACQAEEVKSLRRTQRLHGFIIAAIAGIFLITAFGAYAVIRVMVRINQRSAEIVAEVASQAANEGDYEQAARLARLATDFGMSANSPPGQVANAVMLRATLESRRLILMQGHTGAIDQATFSPDGRFIASAADDHSTRIWDAGTGKLLRTLPLAGDIVYSVTFSPDGKRLATGSFDSIARIWQLDTGKVINIAPPLKGPTPSAARDKARVRSVTFDAGGKWLLTGSDDDKARIWDADTGKLLVEMPRRGEAGPTDYVTDAAFSPDGTRVATSSRDSRIMLWDSATGAWLKTFTGHVGWVRSVAFSPDGRFLVSAGNDKTARIWDVATGTEIRRLIGHTAVLASAHFSPDGKTVVTSSWDRTARIWDVATGQEMTRLVGHDNRLWSAEFSADGQRVVTGSDDYSIRVWSTGQKFQRGQPLTGHTDKVATVAFNADGTKVISASWDGSARIWDVATGKPGQVFRAGQPLNDAVFSRDGRFVATAGGSQSVSSDARGSRVCIWDAATERSVVCDPRFSERINSVAFSPDGQRVIAVSADKSAQIWNWRTDKTLRLADNTAELMSAAFSPDGREVVTAGADKAVRIWNAATGQLIATSHDGHSDWIRWVAYNADGSRLITASYDGTAQIRDGRTGLPLKQLLGHDARVWSASFSPNGLLALTASDDGTARIWDWRSGQELIRLVGHGAEVHSAVFSPNGQVVATASYDGTVRLWTVPPVLNQTLASAPCSSVIAGDLSKVTETDRKRAPALDKKLDVDACHLPHVLSRYLSNLF